MNPLAHAARVLARIYEASASAPVPVDLADDDEDTEPVPVVREVRWPSPYRPDRSHDTDFAGTGPCVAAAEDRVLVELAVLTDSHGPWGAARRLFAPDTPRAGLSFTETAVRPRSDPDQGCAISDPSTGKSEPPVSSVSPPTSKGDHQ